MVTISHFALTGKVILGGLMYFGLIVPAYGYGTHARCRCEPQLISHFTAYFSPAIIQSLGHSSIRSQLLSVPPWACAFGVAMTVAIASDYFRHRFIFTLIPALLAITGFAILFAVHNNVHLQYAALFLAASGTYSSMPVIVCWFNTNRECLGLWI